VPLNLSHHVKEMARMFQETFPKHLRLSIEYPNDLWSISANPTQMHQVLMNLCVNARDAMPKSGVLTIRAENLRIDETYALMTPKAKAGPYVLLEVRDSGVGIRPEILDRIFEPFFTTKEVGKGTGLGLSVVLGVVESHGGFVNVYSKLGHGATFKVYLPAIPEETASQGKQAAKPLPKGQGELILIVDDEIAVLEALKMTLKNHGYQVITATEASEAIKLYTAQRQQIKVVLTDLAMPSMDGLVLTHTLKKLEPEVKILVSTGLGQEAKLQELKSLGITTVLRKPHTAETVLIALQQILTGSATTQ
jgi:hypothetical protein